MLTSGEKDTDTKGKEAKEIPLGYIYASPTYLEKYLATCNYLGWNKTSLLNQVLNSYFAAHWRYYAAASELDATARGLSVNQFFDVCNDWKHDLPGYQCLRPRFEPSPLSQGPNPQVSKANCQRIKSIRIGLANGALLRIACIIEQARLIDVSGRILQWHFDEYWENSYAPQIKAAQQSSFERIFEDKESKNDLKLSKIKR